METIDIHYIDFKNLDEKKFIKKLNESEIGVLNIFDLEGTFISLEIKKKLAVFLNRKTEYIHGVALLGIGSGVRKLIFQLIDFPLYIAEDKADGEDWLLSL